MHRTAELEHLFENSGLKGNPIISDGELQELHSDYRAMWKYFHDTEQVVVSSYLRSMMTSVESVIYARKRR